jgi:hypothetical protein
MEVKLHNEQLIVHKENARESGIPTLFLYLHGVRLRNKKNPINDVKV